MDLDCMTIGENWIEFTLPVPTKTFNDCTAAETQNMQIMRLDRFHNPKLCPVQTLLDYLHCTCHLEGRVSQVFYCD